MTLEIFALCRKAALAEDGTSNFEGVFDRITSSSFPVIFPRMSVVVRARFGFLEAWAGEFKLVVVDPDGKPVHPPVVERYRVKPPVDGISSVVSGVFELTNVIFGGAGPHSLVLLVNERIEATLPLQLKKSATVNPKT